ncbi:MAG: signal peptidase I [Chitinispirillales bacterium]|nr:signal peptidase I [Chitinispirillales bacterium]
MSLEQSLEQAKEPQPQPPSAAKPPKSNEKAGILRFFREMGSALAMALIAIVYVIQAFQIPTGSMEDSLLVGDFLLGLKFVYGAPIVPFSQELGIKRRFPAVTKPKPGDVVIFRYPGTDKKDYIKRMVAGPGDVIEIIGNTTLVVNGANIKLPPRGKYTGGNRADPRITNFAPLYIPAKGDILTPDTMPVREFLFFKNLVHQENPTKKVRMHFDLYIDGELANNAVFNFNDVRVSLQDLQNGKLTFRNEMMRRTEVFDFNRFDDWTTLDYFLETIRKNFPGRDVSVRNTLFLGDARVDSYAVQFDNYFMIGDNRDNSLDSRYWGYLNRNFVKAKAFILYFSFDSSKPLWQLPMNIRWDRVGKLIRDWDGVQERNERVKF